MELYLPLDFFLKLNATYKDFIVVIFVRIIVMILDIVIVIVLIQNQFTPTRSRKHGYFLQVFLCHTHTKVNGHPYTHPSIRTHIHTPRYTDTLTHT